MTTQTIELTAQDMSLVVAFAGCSLDEKPGSNWVQDAGGLPEYICQIAREIKKSGKTTGSAIAIAVSRVKKWAVTGSAAVKAKAAKAVAQWEALKAKSKGKKVVKASMPKSGDAYLMFCAQEYNVDVVRRAFEEKERAARKAARALAGNTYASDSEDYYPYRYIKEQWTTFLIVQDEGKSGKYYRIPFSVVPATGAVVFGKEIPVEVQYAATDPSTEISDADLQKLLAASAPAPTLTESLALTVAQLDEDSAELPLTRIRGYFKKVGGKRVWVAPHDDDRKKGLPDLKPPGSKLPAGPGAGGRTGTFRHGTGSANSSNAGAPSKSLSQLTPAQSAAKAKKNAAPAKPAATPEALAKRIEDLRSQPMTDATESAVKVYENSLNKRLDDLSNDDLQKLHSSTSSKELKKAAAAHVKSRGLDRGQPKLKDGSSLPTTQQVADKLKANQDDHPKAGKYHVKNGTRVGAAHMIVHDDGTGEYVNSRGEKKPLTKAQVKANHNKGMNHSPGGSSGSQQAAPAAAGKPAGGDGQSGKKESQASSGSKPGVYTWENRSETDLALVRRDAQKKSLEELIKASERAGQRGHSKVKAEIEKEISRRRKQDGTMSAKKVQYPSSTSPTSPKLSKGQAGRLTNRNFAGALADQNPTFKAQLERVAAGSGSKSDTDAVVEYLRKRLRAVSTGAGANYKSSASVRAGLEDLIKALGGETKLTSDGEDTVELSGLERVRSYFRNMGGRQVLIPAHLREKNSVGKSLTLVEKYADEIKNPVNRGLGQVRKTPPRTSAKPHREVVGPKAAALKTARAGGKDTKKMSHTEFRADLAKRVASGNATPAERAYHAEQIAAEAKAEGVDPKHLKLAEDYNLHGMDAEGEDRAYVQSVADKEGVSFEDLVKAAGFLEQALKKPAGKKKSSSGPGF